MNKVKITENGFKKLSKKIEDIEAHIKEILKEKAIAYSASGDGWHDNPGWIQLGQQEDRAIQDKNQYNTILSNAIIIKIEVRNMEVIQIGSIVEISIFNQKEKTSKVVKWEIVGHMEGDLKLGHIAYDSPVAKALIGKKINESVDLILPAGVSTYTVKEFFANW